jgi:hypothetical protein
MIWTFEQDGPFNGESTVKVTNRQGEHGTARVTYSPACKLVGPVVTYAEGYGWISPPREEDILDRRPTFRNASQS